MFNADTCKAILENVNGSQKSVETASARLMFWKRNASDVVRCWEHAFHKADMDKRMVLIYVANDVAQNSRKKGREYIEAFHKALPEAFKHMMKHSDEKLQQRLKKLVYVWKDRNVWGNRALALYFEMVRGVGSPSPEEQKQVSAKPQGLPEELKKALPLIQAARGTLAVAQRASAGEKSEDVLYRTEVCALARIHSGCSQYASVTSCADSFNFIPEPGA